MTNKNLWLGTEASYLEYLGQNKIIEDLQASQDPVVLQARSSYDSDESDNPLLEMSGSIAVININGMITNRDDWIAKFLGMTTYAGIRDAMLTALENQYCQAIVLNISSPGGQVEGVDNTAQLIPRVDALKPVYAYAMGNMTSAAYWLGCSAREVYAGVTSYVGSIGVMARHRELSKMYEKEGVTDTNIRGGKYKALAQDNEPLSAEAKQMMQDQVDYLYGIFLDHVSAMRGKSSAAMHSIAADGREFIGQQAIGVGLIDGIMTFDEFMSMVSAKTLDNGGANANTASKPNRTTINGDRTMSTKALTDQQVAALAAGASTTAASTGAETTAAATDAGAQGTAAAGTAAAGTEATTTEATTQATTEAAATADKTAAGTTTEAASASVEMVAFLKDELKAANNALAAANTELGILKATGDSPHLKALTDIAIAACNNMAVGLGGTAIDMSAMTAAQIVAHHGKLAADFKEKFKAGGVAAVDATTTETEMQASKQVDPLAEHRLKAAGGRQKATKS
jgi:signal peptide peptidase SppA